MILFVYKKDSIKTLYIDTNNFLQVLFELELVFIVMFDNNYEIMWHFLKVDKLYLFTESYQLLGNRHVQ